MYALDGGQRKISVMSGVSDVETITSGTSDGDFGPRKKNEYCDGNLRISAIFDCTREVICVRFSFDGAYVAAGQADGVIKVFQTDTGHNVFTLSDEDTRQTNLPVTCIRFKVSMEDVKPEHKHILIATYASGLVKVWHYTSGHCLHTINEARQTLAFSISSGGADRFVTCGADPQLHMYDMETKQKILTMEPSDSRDQMDGHRLRVFAVQHHPRYRHLLASGGWDDTVQFWDEREHHHHAIRKLYGPHICGDGLDIDGTHDHILTGSWRKDNVLQIWDFKSGELIKDVPQDNMHGSLLYCCQWLGKENILCGGSELNMARIIDRGTLNTVGQLVDLPQGVYCIDNDRQSNKPKIVVGASCKVYLLKMDKKQ